MKLTTYYERARNLATRDTTTTMTDQAGARETDINVIVQRYGIHGQAPGTDAKPSYEDLSEFPTDLRDLIDTARGIDEHYNKLPEALKHMEFGELMALTPEALTNILSPPQPAAEEPK